MGLWDTITSPFRTRWFKTATQAAEIERTKSADARNVLYDLNQALYDNVAYVTCWNAIKSVCFPDISPKDRVVGHFSPFKEIAEAYQNCLPGTFGNGIDISDTVGVKNKKPVNPQILEPIETIWRDSNLNSDKALIQRYAANLGTVGMRATEVGKRIVVQHDHPSHIFYVEEDKLGNVIDIVLKYKLPQNFGTATDPQFEDVEVVERLNKDEFSQKHDDVEQLSDEQRKNVFGFTPYVILRHKDNGTLFGDWAYKGSEFKIHTINYRITQQGRSIGRSLFPKWFGAAGGSKPTQVAMDEENMTYVELKPDSPTPLFQAIVANVDHAAIMNYQLDLREMIRGRQPEVTINDVKLLASVSGEAILRALTPAKQAILSVRPNYDHAFVRILQMCLSIGADLARWDLGTGIGPGSGDSAYQRGLEAFEFTPRPALPETPQEKQAIATAEVADKTAKFALAKQAQALGVSNDEVFRQAGYSKDEIAAIRAERKTKDVVPVQTL